MLHFFPHYANDVTDTPFAAELRRLGVPHRFFATKISLRYNLTESESRRCSGIRA